MAKAKVSTGSIKQTFGKKKGGKHKRKTRKRLRNKT